MKHYQFVAEHITRGAAIKLVRKLEDDGVDVEHADMDQIFSNQMIMIVTCSETSAAKIRNSIWEVNNGMCCDITELTDAQFEEYL